MADLDEFRKQLLAGLAQQVLAAKSAHEELTPQWLKPYQTPEIPPGMVAGKIGPGEMNPFERMLGAAMDLAPTPAPAAAVAGGVGAKSLKELLKHSEHLYDIEKKLNMQKVTLPTLNPSFSQSQVEAISAGLPRSQLPGPWSSVPESALEAGFTTPAAHWTAGWKDLTRFPLQPHDIGAHFGSPRAGADLWASRASSMHADRRPRTIPSVLQIKNPLDLKDLGGWGVDEMQEALKFSKRFDPQDLKALRGQPLDAYRKFLSNQGFDAIRYINMSEDPGSLSFAMFKADPKMPGTASGIKLPWAKFKDLSSSDISSVLAGLGLTGTGATIALKTDVGNRLEQ